MGEGLNGIAYRDTRLTVSPLARRPFFQFESSMN